jgi:hypothetical protein
MNQAAVTLLANALESGALEHPGDDNTPPRPIILSGFRNTGMDDQQAKDFKGAAAQLQAEAIVHLFEQAGIDLTLTRAEVQQLRAQAAEVPDGRRIIHVHPDNEQNPAVLQLTVTKDSDHVTIPSRALKALTT